MTPTTPTAIAIAYFDAWRARDFAAYRALLADDATFDGPLGSARSADECVAGMRGLAEITTDVTIERIFTAGDEDVVTWFLLRTTLAPDALPVANWTHVENGRIAAIRVTFDPRAIAPPR